MDPLGPFYRFHDRAFFGWTSDIETCLGNQFSKNRNFFLHIIIDELIELSNPDISQKTIFIFPEGVFSNIYLEDLNNYRYIFSKNYSDQHKIVIGINSKEESKIFNSMVVLDSNLNILSKYNKNKLVPFGEFLPFENFFRKFGLKKITQGYSSFSSDVERKVIRVNNINFVPLRSEEHTSELQSLVNLVCRLLLEKKNN